MKGSESTNLSFHLSKQDLTKYFNCWDFKYFYNNEIAIIEFWEKQPIKQDLSNEEKNNILGFLYKIATKKKGECTFEIPEFICKHGTKKVVIKNFFKVNLIMTEKTISNIIKAHDETHNLDDIFVKNEYQYQYDNFYESRKSLEFKIKNKSNKVFEFVKNNFIIDNFYYYEELCDNCAIGFQSIQSIEKIIRTVLGYLFLIRRNIYYN